MKYFSSDFATSSEFRVGYGSWTFQSALLEYSRMWVRGAGSVRIRTIYSTLYLGTAALTDLRSCMNYTICFYVKILWSVVIVELYICGMLQQKFTSQLIRKPQFDFLFHESLYLIYTPALYYTECLKQVHWNGQC